jgi:cytochrome P450
LALQTIHYVARWSDAAMSMTTALPPHSIAPVPVDLPAPPHVPKALIHDLRFAIGYFSNRLEEPYQLTEQFGSPDIPRVMWSPFEYGNIDGGLWVVKSYEDCAQVYQNDTLFSTEGGAQFQALAGETFPSIPFGIDPPDHGRYRAFLRPWFTPQAVSGMALEIRELCDAMIDDFLARGGGDFGRDFARVFPVRVFLKLMGFPIAMFEQFLAWEEQILHSHDAVRIGAAAGDIVAWLRGFIAEKLAEQDDSLTSQIVNGVIDGKHLTPDEQIGIVFFLWLGGLDTVASTLSLMFRRLALDRALQQRLRENPQEWKSAVEEFLRTQPLVNSARKLKQDTDIFGVAMKRGDYVMALTAFSNFDPSAFPCPRVFDPLRKANRHMTFASGIHLCLGAPLARQELLVALDRWLSRVPMFSLSSDDTMEVVPAVIGARNLKLTW